MADVDVRELRESLEESQAAFGERFGVDQPTVSRWEKRGLPKRGAAKNAVQNFAREVQERETAQ